MLFIWRQPKMEKTLLANGKHEYTGSIFDFNFIIELGNDEEFETWIKSKLQRYRMNPLEKKIYQHLLGMDKMMDRIIAIEERIK